jgi:hypothetical protein
MIQYHWADYNEYQVLKVPGFLLLAMIYLLKHLVIFVLPLISQIPALIQFAHTHFSLPLLLSSAPIIPLIISWLRRVPQTRSFIIRRIWQYGRLLLITSLISEFILIILFNMVEQYKMDETWLLFLYLDLVFMIYVLKSQRVRDVFAQFPSTEKF